MAEMRSQRLDRAHIATGTHQLTRGNTQPVLYPDCDEGDT